MLRQTLNSAAIALALLAATAPGARAEGELAAAQSLLLKGRYDEAADRFGRLLEADPTAAIGLARCKLETGKRHEAVAALTAAAERFPKTAVVRGELALASIARGAVEEARRHVDTALALDKDCVTARWADAELLRLAGRLDEAERGYGWFINYYARSPRIDDPGELVIIARGVAEHARWTRNSNQFRRLVNDVIPAALAREPNYWPAHLQAARLYLEKFNEAEAAAEIARGLAINPSAAELHAARAELALVRFELSAAKSSIDRALQLNPELVWAHQLLADWFFADLRLEEAIVVLQKAIALNPRDEQTLGRLYAAYVTSDRQTSSSARAIELVGKVNERNKHCGEFFLSAADGFDRIRRFSLAAASLRKAQERMPQLISVRGKLGFVLMRLGEEAEAAKLLAESFAIDPFNVRVKNMLEVLDVLKDYSTIETDHFIVKFDRGQDELLGRYAARYLEEEALPELSRTLGFEPEGKTLIELFSRSERTSGHSWFSARMVGLPFIGTVGACAGRMIALTSPAELPEKYDWALVLRHELVHVINLQQTDFAVPHWLTEGLAVHLEGQPRPNKWTELLVKGAAAGELFDLDTLTLGFIRPQSSDDWTLAYCQAELYVEFLLSKYGDQAISKLLAAYADRCTTAEALDRCFGVKQTDLEAGYRRYVEEIVTAATKGVPPARKSLAELQRKAESSPDSAAAAAELAPAWLERDDKPQARRWAVAAKRLDDKQPLAAYVLARLQLTIGDNEGAIGLLENALDRKSPNEDLLTLLAALTLQGRDMAAAQSLYELGDRHFPGNEKWIKGLARVFLQSGDEINLLKTLRRWSDIEPGNLAIHKKLAQLALKNHDFVAATKVATRALHLDVQDAETHALLADAQAGQRQATKAIEEYEVAIRLDSRNADWYAALARLQISWGRKDDARLVLGRLKELSPKHNDLIELEQSLQP